MAAQHIERAFENAIEEHLLGHGWLKGDPDHFDRALALDAAEVVQFIAETQAATWGDLTRQHGAGVGKTVIEWLVKALDTKARSTSSATASNSWEDCSGWLHSSQPTG